MAKKGVGLVAGRAAPALEDLLAGLDRLADDLRLVGPSAGQVRQAVRAVVRQAEGQIEDAGCRALDDDGSGRAVADRRVLREDVLAREDAVGRSTLRS
jgi:hypothetical protein